MELVTTLLVLREYTQSDFDAVHRFASEPEVATFVAWGPNTPQDTEVFLDACVAERAESPRMSYTLAVTAAGSDQFGSVGVYCGDGMSHAEMGFVISPDRWGDGYATEAATAVLGFGFDSLGLHRIWATCRPENLASARVLERIGMQREGHLRDHVCIRGCWRDSFLYAATAPASSG